jgi:hypothetical protein
MENFRIWYQRGSDILKIRFIRKNAIDLQGVIDTKYPYGLVYFSSEHEGETTITYKIALYSMNQEKVLKSLHNLRVSPVECLDSYIDLVMHSHPNLTSTCYDFYLLWDGTWQELDLSYAKIGQLD